MTQLTDNTGIADDSPTWSPDSSMLAFASNRDSDGDIFTMRADGSAVHVDRERRLDRRLARLAPLTLL